MQAECGMIMYESATPSPKAPKAHTSSHRTLKMMENMCHTIIIGDVREYSRLRVKEKLHIFLGEKIRAQNIKMNKYAALVWTGKVLNSRVILMKEFYKVCYGSLISLKTQEYPVVSVRDQIQTKLLDSCTPVVTDLQ